MNFKALFLSLIVGGLLIFISKWLFIVNLFLIPFLLNKYWRQSIVCPDCGHIQNDNICIMNEENRSILEHGRRTKSSTLDKNQSGFDSILLFLLWQKNFSRGERLRKSY